MKKLMMISFCCVLFSGVNAQKRNDCEQLLSKELVYADRMGFWQLFVAMKGCSVDSIDINVFGKASYLNFIYNKFESKDKVYYRDLLREIQAIKKTHDYLNVRKVEVRDAEFLRKVATKESWNEDKIYLERRGFKESELKMVYQLVEKNDKMLSYQNIIFEFQQVAQNQ